MNIPVILYLIILLNSKCVISICFYYCLFFQGFSSKVFSCQNTRDYNFFSSKHKRSKYLHQIQCRREKSIIFNSFISSWKTREIVGGQKIRWTRGIFYPALIWRKNLWWDLQHWQIQFYVALYPEPEQCTVSGHFFTNYINSFHKNEDLRVILRCLVC